MFTVHACFTVSEWRRQRRGRQRTEKDACQRDIKSSGARAGEDMHMVTCSRPKKIVSHTADLRCQEKEKEKEKEKKKMASLWSVPLL